MPVRIMKNGQRLPLSWYGIFTFILNKPAGDKRIRLIKIMNDIHWMSIYALNTYSHTYLNLRSQVEDRVMRIKFMTSCMTWLLKWRKGDKQKRSWRWAMILSGMSQWTRFCNNSQIKMPGKNTVPTEVRTLTFWLFRSSSRACRSDVCIQDDETRLT